MPDTKQPEVVLDIAAREELAKQLVADRDRLRQDKMYLAEILGYNRFQPDVHGELFSCLLQLKPGVALFEQDTKKDRLILWPRSHYKTTAIVVEIIQLILNYPDMAILLMQGTVKLSRGLLHEIKSHFVGEAFNSRLAEYFPEYCADKMGTQDNFTVPARVNKGRKEATITVASAKTVKASQHYDAGFFDDLVNEKNYHNPALLERTIDDFNHYTPLVESGLGYKYVTGTRYAFGDLYEWILRKNVETKSWIISLKQCWTVNPDGTKTLLFPTRRLADGNLIGFTVERLEQIQKEDLGMFAAQYLNLPVSTTTQLFTEELLLANFRSANDKDFPFLGHKILFLDLATSGLADDCVILCAQRDTQGIAYITDAKGGRMTVPTFAQHVVEMALLHRPIKILIEKSAAGQVFKEYCQVIARDKNIYLPLDFLTVNTTKDAKYIRVAALAGDLKNKKLFFLSGLPCWEKIQDQFLRYPKVKYDDWPDTVGLAMEFFRTNQIAPLPIAHPIFAPRADSTETLFLTQQPEPASMGGSMGSFYED